MHSNKELFQVALDAATQSYSPYSHFRVGAALLCEDGTVIQGTNVENRSFGLTICAERSALVAAISAGKKKFHSIAIATPDSNYPVSPCGACRQVLSEFLSPETSVIFGSKIENCIITSIEALLPFDALHDLAQPEAKA
jgi:cytidine deaminase